MLLASTYGPAPLPFAHTRFAPPPHPAFYPALALYSTHPHTKQGVVLAGAEQLTFTWELEPESEVQQFANRVTKYVCKKVYQPSETAPPRMCCACWMDVALGGAGWTGGPVRVGEQFLKKPKTES